MAAAAFDRERLAEEYRMLLFGVRRSVRYHQRRRAFHERLHGRLLFGIVASGVVAMASLSYGAGSGAATVAAAAMMLLPLFASVAGSMRKAILHLELGRRFIALERDLILLSDVSEAELARATRNRLAIESDEPPVLRVLDTLCHNELLRAMGYPASEFVRVTRLQRLLANWADFRFDAPPR